MEETEVIEEVRYFKANISMYINEIEALIKETERVNKEYKKVKINENYLKSFTKSRNDALKNLENLRTNILSTLDSANNILESCTTKLEFFHNIKISLDLSPEPLKLLVFKKKKRFSDINESIVMLNNELQSIQRVLNSLEQCKLELENECFKLSNQKSMKKKILNEMIEKTERLKKELNEKNSQLAIIPDLQLSENETTVKRKQEIFIRSKPKIYSNQSSEAETEDSVTNPESKFYTIRDKSDDLKSQKSLLLIDQARMRNEIRILQNQNFNRKVVGNLNTQQESQLLFKYFVLSVLICFSILYLY